MVKLATGFVSHIEIEKDDMSVNAKSIMGVMMLAAECGSVIRLKAEPEDVEKAAKAVEEHANAKGNEAFRKEIGRIANTIIDNGKLENYGTGKAQDYLKKWAKEYGTKKEV